MSVKTHGQNWEHLEAVWQEVEPVLWHLEDLTGQPFVGLVSEWSTVANLLSTDLDGRIRRGLEDRLGVPIDWRDTLVRVARRFRDRTLASNDLLR